MAISEQSDARRGRYHKVYGPITSHQEVRRIVNLMESDSAPESRQVAAQELSVLIRCLNSMVAGDRKKH